MPVRVITLGCKANAYDSVWIGRVLEDAAADAKEVVVLNTCSVTNRADSDAKKTLRRLRRENPMAVLVVTGCMAQLAPQALQIEGLADYIVTPHELKGFVAQAGMLSRRQKPEVHVGNPFKRPSGIAEVFLPEPRPGRSRPFLKVQDGCDGFCSFCVIPFARGKSRSKPLEHVLEELKGLALLGYEEVVLTGIRLSAYGKDLGLEDGLLTLLRAIEERPGGVSRLRVSSLEPHDLTEGFLKHVQESKLLCPHYPIALQSGDDHVLKAMRRGYGVAAFERVASWLFEHIPDVHLGLDVIVGFPQESQEAFQRTYALIERYPFARLHVFPFSAKEGTPAAKMPGQIPSAVASERASALRELDKRKRLAFADSQVGKVRAAILERAVPKNGRIKLKTDNYLDVWAKPVAGLELRPGRLLRVKLGPRDGQTIYAELHPESGQ
jgi:threonylcarbamoyladenosine tRNA methylthiotransferase MtaB